MQRFIFLLLLLVPLAAASQRLTLVDRIVAIVNKDVITYSELNEAISAAERQLRRQGTQAPEREVLERQMLERLILDKAQLQMARDTGIRVDDLQVDRAVQRIAEQNRLTLADFRRALERDGVSFAAYREDLREQIILTRLREREVDDKVQVSDTEIDLFMQESGSRTDEQRAEYNVSHILVRIPDQASSEQIDVARAKAEKARAEASATADFGKVAATYSDAPDALQGGTLGWRTQDRMPELFATELLKMKPGEVSEVLRSPGGFHVLKLIERRGASDSGAVVQTHLRHILMRPSDSVSESEVQRRLADLRDRIVTGRAEFAELARVHSEDATAGRGGDLEWIFPGDTVPEFERAYQELKDGEISPPVKSSFGYHLIQVLGRRAADLSPERRRLQARQSLRERKADEAYQDWLRQLRDQSYVELRLEDR